MFTKWLVAVALICASAFSVAGEAAANKHAHGKKAAVVATVHKSVVKKAAVKAVKRQRVRHAKSSVRHVTRTTHARKVTPRRYAVARSDDGRLVVMSSMVLVVSQDNEQTIYAKHSDIRSPIASLTKLMTAMVVLDANLPLSEPLMITQDDVDMLRGSSSRLPVGSILSREDMLHLALMSSENRAASALSRAYPGGRRAFVEAMNRKAREIGMTQGHFIDPTGLHAENSATAQDLVKMVKASYQYPLIRRFSTSESYDVALNEHSLPVHFRNTNALIKNDNWDIGLSKTGYINEAGRCLVMQARIAQQPVIIVLLDSQGTYARIGDANRLKKWIETKALRASSRTAKLG
ncbi:MAG: D-alanyl-D-alanine endopeptidase [Gammaproteobacteria bacterium]